MVRGLVVGVVAFAAAFAAERFLVSVGKDLIRYDSIRKMSGQEPLAKEVLTTLASVVTGSVQKNGLTTFIGDVTNDVVRYAKMRGM